MTTFREWFNDYQLEGESLTRASTRLAAEAEVSWPSVSLAVKGRPVGRKTAIRIARVTGFMVHPRDITYPDADEFQ